MRTDRNNDLIIDLESVVVNGQRYAVKTDANRVRSQRDDTLVGGIVLGVTFVFVESRLRTPMMPLTLFRSRNFAGANVLTLFLYAALAGTLVVARAAEASRL